MVNPIVSTPTGVVTLADGTTRQGDLTIGADGTHSAIRGAVLPDAPEPSPTVLSTYRLLIDTTELEGLPMPKDVSDPQNRATTMMMGHERRVIMDPRQRGKLLGVGALVPDEHMLESSAGKSWISQGSMEKLLDTI